MKKEFIERYDEIENSKKLNFLKQLLLKDSDLQQQFLEFTKGRSLDEIVGVDIEDIRTRIYNELVEIDVADKFEGEGHYHDYYDEMDGDELIEEVITPYYNEVIEYINKGNSLDAFRQILAIYELSIIDIPEIPDDYCVFGDGFALAIYYFVSVYPNKLSDQLTKVVLSLDNKKILIALLFEKYKNVEHKYNLNHFQSLLIYLIDDSEMAHYFLNILEEKGLYSIDLALVLLQISNLLDDDKLFLKVANEFYLEDKEVGHQLLKRHKNKHDRLEFANIAGMLLEKNAKEYALYIIENLDKDVYKTLYIKALKAYIDIEFSMTHYKILRAYLTNIERLAFIDGFKDGYSTSVNFYINLLELEKEYVVILNFVRENRNVYALAKTLKPIATVYPDEVFEIIKKNCDRLVNEKGRDSYKRASELLKLMLNVPQKKEVLKSYVSKLYNHQPRLPALRDELGKAGLL
ncbi:hypothetical protein KKC13_05050 [bacterium]|nr:hypothetical protein [bacterium]MBU1959414.1 hypothetical protein [bacterium]